LREISDTEEAFVTLYTILVRCHLEYMLTQYGIDPHTPSLIKDLEKVQMKARATN